MITHFQSFQHFVNGLNELGWDPVGSKSASPTPSYYAHHSQLTQTVLSEADSFCALCSKTLLQYFMFPNSVCVLLKINFHAFMLLVVSLIFLLFQKVLEVSAILY